MSETTIDKRQLLAICTCLGLVTFSGSITVSLLPVYALQLGADTATAGLLVSVAFLTVMVGNIIGGWLCDRLGKRKVLLLISSALWIPTFLLMAQTQDIRWLILTTGICWLPGGVALASLNIMAALSTVEGERGKVFGWTALASGVSGLVAGTAGGAIADHWGFPALFVVMAATTCAIFAIALYIREQSTQPSTPQPQIKASTPTTAQGGVGIPLLMLLGACLLLKLSQSIAGLATPVVMTNMGFDTAAVASTIAVSAAITLPLPLLLGWLSDKSGRKRLLVLCYVAASISLFVLIPATLLWHFWLSVSLEAISASAGGVAQAFVADLTPPHAMGRGMSLLSTATLGAGILGASGAGYSMQLIGINPTLLLGAALPLICIALVVRIRKATPAPDALVVAQV